jgi:hypothetical protein
MSKLFLFIPFLFSAAGAISFVNANNASTFWAGPSGFFIFNKFFNAIFLNILKIFDHTHTVFSSVSFIQMFQRVARKVDTIKAKFNFAISKY